MLRFYLILLASLSGFSATQAQSAGGQYDTEKYDSALAEGIRYFEEERYDLAINRFEFAKSFTDLDKRDQYLDVTNRLEQAYEALLAETKRNAEIARRNAAQARQLQSEAETARDTAEAAQRRAEIARDTAKAAQRRATIAAENAARERDASIARHLAFGAVEANHADTALYLAYYALDLEFDRDTFYTGVRKAFGDAVYGYSNTPVYRAEDRLRVRNFWCVPGSDQVLVLSARQLADTVMGPDHLQSFLLRPTPEVDTLSASTAAVSYDLPADYRVRTLAFTSDGERFITGGTDGRILLWATHSARLLDSATLERPAAIHALSFASDQRFIVATEAGTVATWSYAMDRLRPQASIGGGEADPPVYSIGFTPNSDRFFTRGAGTSVQIWSPGRTQPDTELPAKVYAYEAALYRDGTRLLIADATDEIASWDIATRQRLGTLSCRRDTVTRFAFAEGSSRLFLLENGGRVTLTDADRPDAACRSFAFDAEVTTARFAPATDTLLLLGFADGSLRLLDTTADRLAQSNFGKQEAVKMDVTLSKKEVAIRKVDFSHRGAYWLALDESGQLVISAGYDATYRGLQQQPPQLNKQQKRLFGLPEDDPESATR